jgi:hypothetical protein
LKWVKNKNFLGKILEWLYTSRFSYGCAGDVSVLGKNIGNVKDKATLFRVGEEVR